MGWEEKHSVNCHCCGKLTDEREAQQFTEDSGYFCPDCWSEIVQTIKDAIMEVSQHESYVAHDQPRDCYCTKWSDIIPAESGTCSLVLQLAAWIVDANRGNES